jgi:hypothetical protein
MVKKILISLVLVMVLDISIKAQTVPSPTEVTVNLETIGAMEIPDAVLDTLTDTYYLLQQEPELKLTLNIILQDTNQISKINIKLGTTSGGIELLNQSFIYDQTNLGAGLSYERKGNYVKLGLGNYDNTTYALYYAEVEIEDASGNKSTIISTDTSN